MDARYCGTACQVAAFRRQKAHGSTAAPPSGSAIKAVLADPRRVLAAIAADPGQPAASRVSACKTLLQHPPEDAVEAVDAVTAAAIKAIASQSRRAN